MVPTLPNEHEDMGSMVPMDHMDGSHNTPPYTPSWMICLNNVFKYQS